MKGTAIDPEAMHRAKRTFYTLMGWDPVTGIPTQEKLEELGIAWVVPEMAPA
jgi:aldehyde:ferredoxin oxidoreductase